MSQELLQQYGILLIIVGLILVALLLVLLVLRRRASAKKGLRPAAAAAANLGSDEQSPAAVQMDITISQEDPVEQTKTDGGFQLFKKKKSKSAKQKKTSAKSAEADAEIVARLEDLEQQMLALRELFRAGDITRSVYIAETKALYDIAQTLRQ